MSKLEMPTNYTCPKCETEHEFTAWVFAHWDERIDHTCPKCNSVNPLREGKLIGGPRAKRKI